jgi:hypothetical protein
MGWAVGWDNAVLVATSLQVLPGDPNGVDTSAAGALVLGGVNATSVAGTYIIDYIVIG